MPRFDGFGNSVRLFDRIRIDNPAGNLADDATMAAANAYFEAGKFSRADQLYTDLREAFPDSSHQFEAHLLGLKCKLLIYQGPDYDGSSLKQADKLARQLRRRFPNQYSEKREMIDRTHAEVRQIMAQRDWYRAEYHRRRGEMRGAQHYYDRIVKEFPQTNIAQSARERLTEQRETASEPSESRLAALQQIFELADSDLPPLKSSLPNTIRQ